jgi:hypothetical protein
MRSIGRAGAAWAVVTVLLVSLSSQGGAHGRQQKGNPPSAPPRPASLNRVTLRLEELIPQLLREGTVPGLSIALISDGKLAWQQGFGLANADTKTPVANDSVFEAASLSLSWGLGWGLEDGRGGPAFWHWGDNGNNKAFVYVCEKSRKGVAIYTDGYNGLSIVPEIVDAAVGSEHPAFRWLKIEPYDSPVNKFFKVMADRGVLQGLQEYRARRKTAGGAELIITEDQMNQFGYSLLSAKRVKDAIEVFKLNVEEHPESWNTYDSLGEAYMIDGNTELAIKNYERSVELNPQNKNGIEQLKKLKGK